MNNSTHYLILQCNTCDIRVGYMVALGVTPWDELTYLSEKFEAALRLEYECPKCEMVGPIGLLLCNENDHSCKPTQYKTESKDRMQ